MNKKIVVIYMMITAVLLYTTMYGCIGYGIHLGYKKCRRPPLIAVMSCMMIGLFGIGMFITYLIMKG